MRYFFCFFYLLAGLLGSAEKPEYILKDPEARTIVSIKDDLLQRKYGAQMAGYMQALRPTAAINGKGHIQVRSKTGKRTNIAVQFRAFSVGAGIVNQYTTSTGTLTIHQKMNQDTQYTWTEIGKQAEIFKGTRAGVPFAGSDFWMFDLGLEMLRWPHQNVIKRQMRRGEFCSVLVSRPEKVEEGAYGKVVSWVDEDSMGIVRAQLFDSEGKVLKVFEPKSFKKIDGQWHLKEMEMRNEQTGTRTSIRFDLEQFVKPSSK